MEKQYRIFDANGSLFQEEAILKAKTPKEAMDTYAKWNLKMDNHTVLRRPDGKGRFVVYGGGKSFVYDIAIGNRLI